MYVYRYLNINTKEYDYIGITKNLSQRLYQHRLEDKFNNSYKIEYFKVNTKADAEIWEGHLIAKYETYKRLNVAKASWGLCSYLPNDEDMWKEYLYKPKDKNKNSTQKNKNREKVTGSHILVELYNKDEKTREWFDSLFNWGNSNEI